MFAQAINLEPPATIGPPGTCLVVIIAGPTPRSLERREMVEGAEDNKEPAVVLTAFRFL